MYLGTVPKVDIRGYYLRYRIGSILYRTYLDTCKREKRTKKEKNETQRQGTYLR